MTELESIESREALGQRIAEDYDVEKVKLVFKNLQLEILRVRDPNSILDDNQILAGHDEVEWQPYWAQAWDAAIAMSHVLVEQDFSGRRILDLGCGLGITGAVIAAQGGQVTLGDYAPPAVEFSRYNCWPWRATTAVRRLDWRKDQLGQKFDQILAADILYDRSDIPFLDSFLRDHLNPGSTFLHGDPNRALTNEFFDKFRARGWKVVTRRVDLPGQKTLRLAEFQPESNVGSNS